MRNDQEFNVFSIEAIRGIEKFSHGAVSPVIEIKIVYFGSIKDSMIGVTINNNLSRENHVRSIANSASKKLGFLFRAKSYFTPSQLLMVYKAQIRPVLKYCSHIWSAAPKHILKILDSVNKK